jgi:hypothetical protein
MMVKLNCRTVISALVIAAASSAAAACASSEPSAHGSQSKTQFTSTRESIRAKFQSRLVDQNITIATPNQTVRAEMLRLGLLQRQGSSAAGDALRQLQKVVNTSFQASLAQLQTNSSSMAAAIAHGSLKAAAAAGKNFMYFQSQAREAMNAGVISTSLGAELIAHALDSTLKALGGGTIPIPAIEHQQFLQKLGVGQTGPDSQFNP